MTKVTTIVCAAALGLFLGGCARDIASRHYRRLPPKSASEVDILWERPARPFTVIADFQSRNESPEDMRARAAEAGADAVIVATLGAIDYSQADEAPRDPRDQTRTYTRIVGTAIIYEE